MALVADVNNIRLALLGMVAENGHPFSWSAIINGRYDPTTINAAGYPIISDYLNAQSPEHLGIAGAQITHVWCDHASDAQQLAQSADIPHIVEHATEVIGHVDAVIIPTDIGNEHLDRARPFIEADLPVFIDKPLTDKAKHLDQFLAWRNQGKIISSCSAMRYAHEFHQLRETLPQIGELRLLIATCAKSWERYGIHALEAAYGLLPPGGWLDVSNTGSQHANIVHVRHQTGVDLILAVTEDMYGGFCHVSAIGTRERIEARFTDSYSAFKAQLSAFVHYLRTGHEPFDFGETVELTRILIAAISSRAQSGRRVDLASFRGHADQREAH